MVSESKRNPLRLLTLLFIATGSVIAFFGTAVGSALLASISGISIKLTPVDLQVHPSAQIYGFIFEFIMGVAYILVPRFKASTISSIRMAYLNYALLTVANIGFIVSDYLYKYFLIFSILFSLATLIFMVQIIKVTLIKKGVFPETDPLIMTAAVSAFFSSLILSSASYLHTDLFSPGSLELSLLGFAGSMIYAVEIRSVSFRQCDYRITFTKMTSLFQASAVAISFLSLLLSDNILQLLGTLLFLLAAVMAIISLRIFELAHPLMYRPSMTQMHYKIMKYNDLSMLLAFFWLLVGLVIGIIYEITDSSIFIFRDLSIHSVAIGFIGSTILCFAPMLLPGLLGRRGPTTGLSYYPVLILNAGLVIRAVGDAFSLVNAPLPSWEALSGPLILISMAWFLFMIHNIGKKKEMLQKVHHSTIDEKTSREIAEIRVEDRPFWFIYKNGEYFIIPKKESILEQKSVSFDVLGRRYSAMVYRVDDRKQVRKLVKLFVDKYGERNFINSFGRNVNLVLGLQPKEVPG
ncbi:MAG: hypothetical protein QXQ39_01995 [Conexivisphaerales archaeon]